MDNETNAKSEDPPSNEDLSNEKALNTTDLATNIKIDTTTSGYDFETYAKTNIEANVNLQNEGQCLYEHVESNAKNNTTTTNDDFEMDSKMKIKEEPSFPDTELPNVEYLDCKSLAAKIKHDTLKKESFTSSDSGEETITKKEIDCQSKVPAVADILHENMNEGRHSGTAENLPSPRFTSAVVYHDGRSHTIPYASDGTASSGKNVDKQVCSSNCNPACGTQHFKSVEIIHGEDIQVYKCKVCEKKFSCHLKLNRHSLSHSRRKLYKCDTCGKCFIDKSHLKTHTLVHTGSKPFKCEHCGKCFTQKSSLKLHTLVHTGSKPFNCEYCDKCFTQKQNLKTHMLVHTGSKPFKCELCGRCFTLQHNLKAHTLVHTGIKPFKCEHCGMCFTLKRNLKTHTFVHTGSKPFKCGHCDKCFTRKSDLKRHTLHH